MAIQRPLHKVQSRLAEGRPIEAMLASATCQIIHLADIRGAHPLVTQTLERLHPRPIDDVMTLTPAAVKMLCTLHPLVVQPFARGRSKGFKVLGGLLAWRALRPHHALLAPKDPPSQNSSTPTDGEDNDTPSEPTTQSTPQQQTRQRRVSAPPPTLPSGFQVPAIVLSHRPSDDEIDALLLAERWLLLSCAGPLKALQPELVLLHQQAEERQWIDDLTPGITSLAALTRVLGTSRQTLHARRRKTFRHDDEHQSDDANRAADPAATEQRRPEGDHGADVDRSP